MANNRMYLSCVQCKGKLFLAKYYPGAGYYTNSDEFQKKLDDWMDSHIHGKDMDEWTFGLEYETSLEASAKMVKP